MKIRQETPSKRAHSSASRALLLAITAATMACASDPTLDANEESAAADDQESVAASDEEGVAANEGTASAKEEESVVTGEQSLLVKKSVPMAPNKDDWANTKDHFVLELPPWNVHNNGSLLRSATIKTKVTVNSVTTSQEIPQSAKYTDGSTITWPSEGISFDVERVSGKCFVIFFWAEGFVNLIPPANWYCYDDTSQSWVPEPGYDFTPKPIGTMNSPRLKDKLLEITFNHRVRWVKTTIDGRLLPDLRSEEDGTDWHHFNATLYGNPAAVNIDMVPANDGHSDPDLHASTTLCPSLSTYECRPWLGIGASESCQFTSPKKVWASVHNWNPRPDYPQVSDYTLTISPTY